ncbi:MAG: hypothetical protein P8Y64_08680 [Gammaproteobacteria bacterium]|jgi:hypothetical protein
MPASASRFITSGLHPATLWANNADFSPEQVDCITAVALKVLDNKCKMSPAEKAAGMAVYDAVKHRRAHLFDASVHRIVETARLQPDATVLETIHQLRLHAEDAIPKPAMKRFKAFLRQGLFGQAA